MAIKQKPIPVEPQQVDVEEFINQGGGVAKDVTTAKKIVMQHHLLDIPSDLFEKVKDSVKRARVISRNGWILQAVIEKLEREQS